MNICKPSKIICFSKETVSKWGKNPEVILKCMPQDKTGRDQIRVKRTGKTVNKCRDDLLRLFAVNLEQNKTMQQSLPEGLPS